MADAIDLTLAPLATAAELPDVEVYAQKRGSPVVPRRVSVSMLLSFIAAAANGYVRYATTALREADTTRPAGVLAYVYNNGGSPTNSENGFWQATGISGTPWVRASWISNDLIAAVQPSVDLAQAWAESATAPGGSGTKSAKTWASSALAWAEGTLPGGAGTKSAKEWATDASTSAIAAATSASAATAANYANGLHPGYADAVALEKAAMDCVEALQIFGVPAGKYISWKYLFWKDTGTRFNATLVYHDDVDGTNPVDACTFSVGSGADAWTTPRLIEMAAMSGSGITASFIFTPPAAALTLNQVSTTTAIYRRRRISRRSYRSSASRTADIVALINAQLALNATVAYAGVSISPLVNLPTSASSTVAKGALACTRIFIDPLYGLGVRNIHLWECGRRISDGNFRAQIGTFDGMVTTTLLAATGNNFGVVTTGYTGIWQFPLTAQAGNSMGITAGTVIGFIEINFGAGGADIGTYANKLTWAEGALVKLRIQPSAIEQAAIVAMIERAAAAKISNANFARPAAVATITKDIYARSILSRIDLDGVKAGRNYQIGYLVTSATRFEVRFIDETSGRYVATAFIDNPNYGALPDFIRIRVESNAGGGVPAGGFTGITGRVSLKGASVTVGTSVHTWTAGEDGSRLAAQCLTTFDQVTALFMAQKVAMTGEVVRVAPSSSTALMTAVRGLYDAAVPDDLDIITVHWCPRAGPRNPVIIDLDVGEYFASNLKGVDWVFFRGKGKAGVNPDGTWDGKGTLIRCLDTTMARPPLQLHQNIILVDLTVYCDTTSQLYGGPVGQYCGHSDINNGLTQPDSEGSVNYQYNQYVRARLIGGPANTVQAWGGGLSNPGFVDLDLEVERRHPTSTQPFVACHTCANASNRPGRFRVKLTVINRPAGQTCDIAVQSEQPWLVPMELIVDHSPTVRRVGYSGAIDGGWIGTGTYDGPVYSSDADVYLDFSTVAVLKNDTATTIPAKMACTSWGNLVVPTADGGVVDAIALKAVAPGATGKFIVSRKTDIRNVMSGVTDALIYVNNGVPTTTPTASGRPIGRAKDGILTLADI